MCIPSDTEEGITINGTKLIEVGQPTDFMYVGSLPAQAGNKRKWPIKQFNWLKDTIHWLHYLCMKLVIKARINTQECFFFALCKNDLWIAVCTKPVRDSMVTLSFKGDRIRSRGAAVFVTVKLLMKLLACVKLVSLHGGPVCSGQTVFVSDGYLPKLLQLSVASTAAAVILALQPAEFGIIHHFWVIWRVSNCNQEAFKWFYFTQFQRETLLLWDIYRAVLWKNSVTCTASYIIFST